MIRLLILLYGISLTEAYTIKLSGKVELGNQLSQIFKDVYSQLADNGYFPDEVIKGSSHKTPDDDPDDYNSFEQGPDTNKHVRKSKKHKELPLLDKMMKNDLEQLHLYGLHKYDSKTNDGKPLNNVNL